MIGQEARQTTSNVGHLNKPSIQALIHGLNRHYYSLVINYRKNELEQKMLANLHKKKWTEGLTLIDFHSHQEQNEKTVKVRHPATPALHLRTPCHSLCGKLGAVGSCQGLPEAGQGRD
jgi:hypothetical protein